MQHHHQSNDFQPLFDLIRNRTGILLNENQRLDVMAIASKLTGSEAPAVISELASELDGKSFDHPMWQDFVRVATVGETYFFRDRAQFNALRTSVLPELIEERRRYGVKHLRLWSAGCAGGEEAYSLAMLLQELLSDIDSWSISILATDINKNSLDSARRGLYRPWSFRAETPGDIRDRWFQKVADGFQISDTLRHMVNFRPLNLVSDTYPSYDNDTVNIDLIVCRNVTIYFDQPTVRQIVTRFHRVLIPSGWLNVGYSEPNATTYEDLFTARNFDHAVLYQKSVVIPQEPEQIIGVTKPLTRTAPPGTTRTLGQTQPLRPLPQQLRSVVNREVKVEPAPTVEPAFTTSADQINNALSKARQFADKEEWDEALNWLARAETFDRLNPYAHYLHGLIELHHGKTDEAILALRQAVYCDFTFALAHLALTDIYVKKRESKLALNHLQMAQSAITGLGDDDEVPFANDLTAQMLRQLITLKTKNILQTANELNNVNL